MRYTVFSRLKKPFHTTEMEYFAACVRGGRQPEINGWDEAIHIAEVTAAAYDSWRKGCFARLP